MEASLTHPSNHLGLVLEGHCFGLVVGTDGDSLGLDLWFWDYCLRPTTGHQGINSSQKTTEAAVIVSVGDWCQNIHQSDQTKTELDSLLVKYRGITHPTVVSRLIDVISVASTTPESAARDKTLVEVPHIVGCGRHDAAACHRMMLFYRVSVL